MLSGRLPRYCCITLCRACVGACPYRDPVLRHLQELYCLSDRSDMMSDLLEGFTPELW